MPSPEHIATLTASIATNLIVTNTTVHVLGKKSTSLREYYARLNGIAVALDITSLTWGVLLAQRFAKGSVGQIAAAVVIQLVHDVSFGWWLRRSTVKRPTLDLFRNYAAEHGTGILKVDAVFMVVAVVLSRVFRKLSPHDNALVGTMALYTHLLLLDAL